MAANGSNKAKIAKRVIEVLEFFDDEHPQATVMDIVRRFDRPQSSTSELLSSLVEVGMLYKDPHSRSYSPTPRAAMLGCAAQPDIVRDGRLTGMIDRLAAQTGLGIAVFGVVGLKVQIYSWRAGQRALRTNNPFAVSGGEKDHLSDSAVGRLLLSTVAQPRRDSMVRRLNAEASDDRKFCFGDVSTQVAACVQAGHVTGGIGFDTGAQVAAVLIPHQPQHQPLAIGFVYDSAEHIDAALLVTTLTNAVARCFDTPEPIGATIKPLFDSTDANRLPMRAQMASEFVAPALATGPADRLYM